MVRRPDVEEFTELSTKQQIKNLPKRDLKVIKKALQVEEPFFAVDKQDAEKLIRQINKELKKPDKQRLRKLM